MKRSAAEFKEETWMSLSCQLWTKVDLFRVFGVARITATSDLVCWDTQKQNFFCPDLISCRGSGYKQAHLCLHLPIHRLAWALRSLPPEKTDRQNRSQGQCKGSVNQLHAIYLLVYIWLYCLKATCRVDKKKDKFTLLCFY